MSYIHEEDHQLEIFQANPCGYLYQDTDGITAYCTFPLGSHHKHAVSAKEALKQAGTVNAYCHADRDGDCSWQHCPQLRDDEPNKSGRHCPIDNREDSDL